MEPAATALRHDAFVYDSDEVFAERMAFFASEGLDAGEDVVAVTTRANCDVLREALGPASERVSFVDRDEWYVRPAHTIAGYHKTVRRSLRAGAPAIRLVGEVQFGSSPEEWREWIAYESILNRAFADQPAWIVCPYDARALPAAVVEHAARTHGPNHDDPDQLVRALTPDPAPLPGLRSLPLDDDSYSFRERLRGEMAGAGVPSEKVDDLILAACEVLSNAHRHGDGPQELRAGLVGDQFVCEIADHGRGLEDPLAGYLPPGPGRRSGAGLWVARQLSTRLELISSGGGLTVRLWA